MNALHRPSPRSQAAALQPCLAPHSVTVRVAGAGVKAAAVLQLMFAADSHEPWRDALVRWSGAALLTGYVAALRRGAGAGLGARAADPPQRPWVSAADARSLADTFAADSFGDALFAGAVALLLEAWLPEQTQARSLGSLAAYIVLLHASCSLILAPARARAPSFFRAKVSGVGAVWV
jgi:hypothetical protein